MLGIVLGAGILVYIFLGICAHRRKDRDLEVKANVFMDLLDVVLSMFGAA